MDNKRGMDSLSQYHQGGTRGGIQVLPVELLVHCLVILGAMTTDRTLNSFQWTFPRELSAPRATCKIWSACADEAFEICSAPLPYEKRRGPGPYDNIRAERLQLAALRGSWMRARVFSGVYSMPGTVASVISKFTPVGESVNGGSRRRFLQWRAFQFYFPELEVLEWPVTAADILGVYRLG